MIEKEAALSVIVPVYNTERYLRACVESILKQGDTILEVILVDDGSSDRSGILCDMSAKEDSRVRALHMEHGGITKARLAGVKASAGKWITFVDADDWIEDDAYKGLNMDGSCDIVAAGICRYLGGDQYIRQMPCLREGYYNREEIINEIIPVMMWDSRQGIWGLDPSLCTKIFRRSLILEYLEKASETGSNYGEDSIVIYPMVLQAQQIRIIRKIYYYHRQHMSDAVPSYIADEDFILKLYKVYEYLKMQFGRSDYWKIMRKQLDCFFINGVELKKRCYEYPRWEFSAYFPTDRIPPGSRVVLYGAGRLGRQYWEQNSLYHYCEIVSWTDTSYKECQTEACRIVSPEVIPGLAYDYVLIAADAYCTAEEIALSLHKLGVKEEKIVWQSTRVNRRGFCA